MSGSQSYIINRDRREIVGSEVISRQYVRDLTEEDVEELVSVGDIRVFVNWGRDALEEIEGDRVRVFWERELMGHVGVGEDAHVSDFERGCFFFAEYWKGEDERNLLVLYYHH